MIKELMVVNDRYISREEEYPIIRLWGLRLARRYIREKDVCVDKQIKSLISVFGEEAFSELAQQAKLSANLEEPNGGGEPQSISCLENHIFRSLLRQKIDSDIRLLQQQKRPHVASKELEKNICRVATLLGLSALDKKILFFVTLREHTFALNELCENFSNLGNPIEVIAYILGATAKDVIPRIQNTSPLSRQGLIRPIDNGSLYADQKLQKIISPENKHLVRALITSASNIEQEILSCFAATSKSSLNLENFQHMGRTLELLGGVIGSSLATPRNGVNILLWGSPGTGKTELALALAKAKNAHIFEVPGTEVDGGPCTKKERMLSYGLAQKLLSKYQRALLLFDEVEDVFTEPEKEERGGIGNKAWWTRALETNGIPCIWITNDVRSIDPAYLRRFDLIVNMEPLPQESRKKLLLDKTREHKVSEPVVDALSKNEHLTAASIERICNVLEYAQVDKDHYQQHLVEQLEASYKAMREPLHIKTEAKELDYQCSYINCDQKVSEIVKALEHVEGARLLMYGPPGVGKTEWAKELANTLGLGLLEKSCSDIFSPLLGSTEKNLADIFSEAQKTKSILLLDEVDSFLRSRELDSRQWEVTQVNEFLIRLEKFTGFVICTTNRIENLDPAAARRFDFKLKFGLLQPDTVIEISEETLRKKGKTITEEQRRALNKMVGLSLGDFKVALRRLRLRKNEWAAEELISELNAEQTAKHQVGGSKPIGFVIN